MKRIFIFRQPFMLSSLFIISALFTALLISSCDDRAVSSEIPKAEEFDILINSKAVYTVPETLDLVNGTQVVKLPLSVFSPAISRFGKTAAVQKIYIDGRPYLKTVNVHIVKLDENYGWAEGINKGAVLLLYPKATVGEFAQKDLRETRERFLRPRLLIKKR